MLRGKSSSSGWVDIAAVAVALIPVIALVVVGYFQATRRIEADLAFLANTGAKRSNAIFVAARKSLQVLALNTQGRCNDAAIKAMRDVVFRSIYFREAGTVIDHKLSCTDNGFLEPPVLITDPKYTVLSDYGEIAIVPPVATLRPGKSIITNFKVTDHAYVNLLINPEIFNEFQQFLNLGEHNGIFILSKDGQHIAAVGNMDPSELPPFDLINPNSPGPQVAHYHGVHYAVVRSDAYPVLVVASASNTYVMQEWQRNALIFGPLGLILSAVLVYFVRRISGRAASMDSQLRRALQRDELSVVYQPVVELDTGRCVGCEALMRWNHPKQGNIPPAVFIPVAEQSDLIFGITDWLMERIARDLAETFREQTHLSVDINIAADHFHDEWILKAARRTLEGRIDMRQIIFELTERGRLSSDDPENLRVIHELRLSGARLSIDDFGVGYSNLSALQKIEFDYLKIDKAFVDGIESEERSSGLVDSVIAIGRASNTEMVAEGVELDYQARYLFARGVKIGQGWLFSEPLPVEKFLDYLREHA